MMKGIFWPQSNTSVSRPHVQILCFLTPSYAILIRIQSSCNAFRSVPADCYHFLAFISIPRLALTPITMRLLYGKDHGCNLLSRFGGYAEASRGSERWLSKLSKKLAWADPGMSVDVLLYSGQHCEGRILESIPSCWTWRASWCFKTNQMSTSREHSQRNRLECNQIIILWTGNRSTVSCNIAPPVNVVQALLRPSPFCPHLRLQYGSK